MATDEEVSLLQDFDGAVRRLIEAAPANAQASATPCPQGSKDGKIRSLAAMWMMDGMIAFECEGSNGWNGSDSPGGCFCDAQISSHKAPRRRRN